MLPLLSVQAVRAVTDGCVRTPAASRSEQTMLRHQGGTPTPEGAARTVPRSSTLLVDLGPERARRHYSVTRTLMRETVHVSLLVPTRDNNDHPFTEDEFETFENVLLETAGGFTRFSNVRGAWRAPDGSIMRDESRAYGATIPEDGADARIAALDAFIREHFRQEAAFIETSSTKATVF